MANVKLFGEALVPGRGGLFAVICSVAYGCRKFEKLPNAVDIIVTPLILWQYRNDVSNSAGQVYLKELRAVF